MLDDSLRKVKLSPHLRLIKIVHGFGSSGRGGTLKALVRNWTYARRSRVKISIPGEQITPFNPDVQELAASCEISVSADLGAANDGATIVWVK